MRILRASKDTGYSTFEEIWTGTGLYGEPLVDSSRIESDGVLSLFTLYAGGSTQTGRVVTVLDFEL